MEIILSGITTCRLIKQNFGNTIREIWKEYKMLFQGANYFMIQSLLRSQKMYLPFLLMPQISSIISEDGENQLQFTCIFSSRTGVVYASTCSTKLTLQLAFRFVVIDNATTVRSEESMISSLSKMSLIGKISEA